MEEPQSFPAPTPLAPSQTAASEPLPVEPQDAVAPPTAPAAEIASHLSDEGAIPAVTATSDTAPAPVAPEISAPAPDTNPAPVVHETPAHTSAGLSAVADFLPADAKLDQPTPSPSEPLGTGTTDAQEDALMTDAADSLPAKSGETQIAPVPVTSLEADSEPVQQRTPAPEPTEPSVNGVSEPAPTPAAQQAATDLNITSTSHNATISTSQSALSHSPQPLSISQAAQIVESSAETAITQPSQPDPVDTQMTDSTSSLTRPRDEYEGDEEPSAKRARLDDFAVETPLETPVNEDFKRPDAPVNDVEMASQSAPAPAPPQSLAASQRTNGTATSHLPARSTYSSEPLTRFQKKTLEEKIKNTKKVKSAFAFLKPVDPVALNIPNYTTVITNPMDLGTMEQKLKMDQYASVEDFVNDFETMVNNCFTFNGPAHTVSNMAMNLRAYFLKQMDTVPTGDASAPQKLVKKESPIAKPQPPRESRASSGPGAPVVAPSAVPAPSKSPGAPGDTFALLPGGTPQIRRDSTAAGRPKRAVIPPAPRDLPYSGTKPKRKENLVGLKFADHVLTELRKPKYDKMTLYFREPVDPVALNIPHYFSIIKHPMDIQTVTNKLKTGQYSAAEDFKADFDLTLQNAFKFNPADNFVHMAAKELQHEFETLWKGKNKWVKEHQPRSARVTPTSDLDSDEEQSSEEEEDAETDEKEATIRALKDQLAAMQNMLSGIEGKPKRESPKASGKKGSKSRASGGGSKSKKSSSVSAAPIKSASKPKQPKKQRLVSYDEKQEISNATEQMDEAQIGKLVKIITDNDPKYKDIAGDDVELEIDDLPNNVQHMLLKYIRSIFPRASKEEPDDAGVDDDYEPERGAKGAGGGRKKHKPMKKQEQESRIAQLSAKVEAMNRGLGGEVAKEESSGDEDSESSEEE